MCVTRVRLALQEARAEAVVDFQEVVGEECTRLRLDVCGDAVFRLRDGGRHGRERVGVTAERDGVADGVLEAVAFEVGDNRLRHAARAGDIELVGRADLIERGVERVPEAGLHVAADLLLARARTRHEHSGGNSLRAADAFGMIMRDLCCLGSNQLDFAKRVERPGGGGDAHARAVAQRKNRTRVRKLAFQPVAEVLAIPDVRVVSPDVAHAFHQGIRDGLVALDERLQDGIGHREGHGGVVGERTGFAEQREIVVLHRAVLVESVFVWHADNVADNRAENHDVPPVSDVPMGGLPFGISRTMYQWGVSPLDETTFSKQPLER